MRLVMSCPALRQDIGPFEDLSVLTKFALVQQVVRTCFCDCLTKCIARATRTNQKTTAGGSGKLRPGHQWANKGKKIGGVRQS